MTIALLGEFGVSPVRRKADQLELAIVVRNHV
jgi:hypothetical protein